ncbi:hypothetical protein [Massilia sp. S19_KUP03_FR1]|uniref:hypothetical protein n=1 Tax=Massilia sp. S19_KUP03_FR1 TaxID=3025503 RepID=UPI002FCD3679
MTTETTTSAIPPARQQQGKIARTDDLLVSGPDAKDGARGFTGNADPQALQTGMEGIAAASHPNRQSDNDQPAPITKTLPDNQSPTRNK